MKLNDLVKRYFRDAGVLTTALLKFCLLSLGVIIGLFIPDTARTATLIVCAVVFVVTYVPLMVKLYRVWKKRK